MTTPQKPSAFLHVALWAAQLLVAATFGWAAAVKLVQPVETVAVLWPWAGQVPVGLVKLTGVVDLLGALGLVLPALLRIRPGLTPLAALGTIVLMVVASIFHIARGEASAIGVNLVFAGLAAFIAWGRWAKVPIAPK